MLYTIVYHMLIETFSIVCDMVIETFSTQSVISTCKKLCI